MINIDNKDKETDKIYVTRTEERDERDNMKKYKTFRTYSRKLAKCNKLHSYIICCHLMKYLTTFSVQSFISEVDV